MDQIFMGIGIGCVVFTTGFLLALGAFAGVKAASVFFGPIKSESNTSVFFKD